MMGTMATPNEKAVFNIVSTLTSWVIVFAIFYLISWAIIKVKDNKKAASEEQRKELAKDRKKSAAIIGVIGIIIYTVLNKVLS